MCPARVNLELVRETLGDLAARAGDKSEADQRYASALAVVTAAPHAAHCFAGQPRSNPDRRRSATPPPAAQRQDQVPRPPTGPTAGCPAAQRPLIPRRR